MWFRGFLLFIHPRVIIRRIDKVQCLMCLQTITTSLFTISFDRNGVSISDNHPRQTCFHNRQPRRLFTDIRIWSNYCHLVCHHGNLKARLAQWLSIRLLHCVSGVQFPHAINICMIYFKLFQVWLFFCYFFFLINLRSVG